MRRRYVTNPGFHISFTLAFVLGAFIALSIPAAALFVALYLVSQDPSLTAGQTQTITQGLNDLISLFVVLLFIAITVFAGIGGYLSYKFAGPMRRLEMWIAEQVQAGPTRPIKLRPGDELTAVTSALNRVIKKYFS